MRLPFVFIKFTLLWAGTAILPVSIVSIFFPIPVALAVFAIIGLFLLGLFVRADSLLRRSLRPSQIRIGTFDVLAIEDPSSHAFVTQGLLSREPSLWITRGALSLLTPDEIVDLLTGMRLHSRGVGLRFETGLTSILVRLTKKIPAGLREIFFFQQKRAKKLLMLESLRGVFWAAMIIILEWFYFSTRNARMTIHEEVLRKLEAESRRCVPRLPVALSSHSAVSPWPDAFLTLGRTCLLPGRAVNLVK